MSLPYIDYFMPSIDEAVCISGKDQPDEIAEVFLSKGASNVIIKLGSKGSYFRSKNSGGKIYDSFSVEKVLDTTGAGDSFCSGFIAAYASGMEIDDCMEFANAVGAMSVMERGATTGTKSFDETIEFIKNYRGK